MKQTLFMALGLLPLLVGCATVYKEAGSVDDLPPDEVIVVGRIEFVPKLDLKNSDFRLGTIDPFNAKDVYFNRALLFFSDRPTDREKTHEVFNPHLDETYFGQVPKEKNLIVYGSVYTKFQTRTNGRQVASDTSEIILPTPIRLDLQPKDTAVYVGTWRFHRDEFGSVTKFEVIDEYDRALARFKKKFGSKALRKALIQAQ